MANQAPGDDECSICYQKMLLPLTLTCNHKYCFLCIKGVHQAALDFPPALCPMCRADIDASLFVRPKLAGSLQMRDSEDSPAPPAKQPRLAPAPAAAVKAEPGEMEMRVVVEKDEHGNDVARAKMMPKQAAVAPAAAAQVKQEPADAAQAIPFWLYEGRKQSWWRFDPRMEKDMEQNFQSGSRLFDVIICGSAYRMDLNGMKQCRLDTLGGQAAGDGRKRDIKRVADANELATLHVKGIAGVRLTR